MTPVKDIDAFGCAWLALFIALLFAACAVPCRLKKTVNALFIAALIVAIAGLALSVRAADQPAEVWLTPERAAQLRRVTARPHVTARETLADGREALRWTNGSREWATTNAVRPMLGKRSPNGWQDRVDKAEKEKAEVIESVKALKAKGKPTASDLDAIIQKAEKAEKK